MGRSFEDREAVREKVPLLVGLIGPSGTGKTYSALRLATGIQRVSGGDIFVIDTESRRALHYADKFKFRHVAFGAPFSPLDYLAAIEHCVQRGASTIIVDSMSHEHEGPGGVLEEHDSETKRLAKAWGVSENSAQMSAWGSPKSKRRRLINTILQMPINCIFCFRAKEKLKIVKGENPQPMGFMPIAGEEFVYEMTAKCLLLPGAAGVPTWNSDMPGERLMMKIPGQFREVFAEPRQLSEDIGEEMARWAAGTAAPATLGLDDVLAQYAACSDPATARAISEAVRAGWSRYSKQDQKRINTAAAEAKARILAASQAQDPEPQPMREPGEDG